MGGIIIAVKWCGVEDGYVEAIEELPEEENLTVDGVWNGTALWRNTVPRALRVRFG